MHVFAFTSERMSYDMALATCRHSNSLLLHVKEDAAHETFLNKSGTFWLGIRQEAYRKLPPLMYRWVSHGSSDKYALRYQGCFLDDIADLDLNVKAFTNDTEAKLLVTPLVCVNKCRTMQYSVAGVKNGYICSCGHNYGKHHEFGIGLALKFCNVLCTSQPAAKKIYCGGETYNQIYLVDGLWHPIYGGITDEKTDNTMQELILVLRDWSILDYLIKSDNLELIVLCQLSANACLNSTTEHITLINGQCLQFIETGAVTWHQARRICVEKGGDLAAVDNKITLTDLFSYVVRANIRQTYAIVGLSNRLWKWEDGSQLMWNNFADNEPGFGKDCAVVDASDANLTWRAVDCQEHHQYMCMQDPTSESPMDDDSWTPLSADISMAMPHASSSPNVETGVYDSWTPLSADISTAMPLASASTNDETDISSAMPRASSSPNVETGIYDSWTPLSADISTAMPLASASTNDETDPASGSPSFTPLSDATETSMPHDSASKNAETDLFREEESEGPATWLIIAIILLPFGVIGSLCLGHYWHLQDLKREEEERKAGKHVEQIPIDEARDLLWMEIKDRVSNLVRRRKQAMTTDTTSGNTSTVIASTTTNPENEFDAA